MEKSKVAVDESTNGTYRNEVPSDLESLPPAYVKPTTANLKIARILAVTLIVITVLVGVMVVIGIYVHHANKCQCDKEMAEESQFRPAVAARIDRMDRTSSDSESVNSNGKKLPMPLKLELDATLGALMKSPKNKKAKVDCVVETKKASQVISEEPKTLLTPFGNFSTDPKLVHLTGEKMVFSCFSAVEQAKKSSKRKKSKGLLLPRPRRSAKETCACNCDC